MIIIIIIIIITFPSSAAESRLGWVFPRHRVGVTSSTARVTRGTALEAVVKAKEKGRVRP